MVRLGLLRDPGTESGGAIASGTRTKTDGVHQKPRCSVLLLTRIGSSSLYGTRHWHMVAKKSTASWSSWPIIIVLFGGIGHVKEKAPLSSYLTTESADLNSTSDQVTQWGFHHIVRHGMLGHKDHDLYSSRGGLVDVGPSKPEFTNSLRVKYNTEWQPLFNMSARTGYRTTE